MGRDQPLRLNGNDGSSRSSQGQCLTCSGLNFLMLPLYSFVDERRLGPLHVIMIHVMHGQFLSSLASL